jgi:hypothetical protein
VQMQSQHYNINSSLSNINKENNSVKVSNVATTVVKDKHMQRRRRKKDQYNPSRTTQDRTPGIAVSIPGMEPIAETAVLAENTFYFQQRRGRLDLRSIARIDIDRVIEDVDIDTLQSHLESIAFADLCADDLAHYADEHFIKLFRLSQLTIEYLLNVQNALLTFAKDAEEETEKIEAACREGERRLRSRKKKMNILKKEIKHNRKVITTYEALLKQKAVQETMVFSKNNNHDDIVDLGGKKYVAVDHIRRQMKEQAFEDRLGIEQQQKEEMKKMQEQKRILELQEAERRSKEELNRLQIEQDKKLREALKLEELEANKIMKELEQERLKRQEAEKKVELAIKSSEESIHRRQEDLEQKFQEELRKMKDMMEQEIAEQRILAQQQMSQMEGKASNVPQPSMAGDLEDDEDGNDDDDLLHDRESWGNIRKSRKELEDLCKDLQDSLREKNESLMKLKQNADLAAQKMLVEQEHSKARLNEERLKAEKLAKTMEESIKKERDLRQELLDAKISQPQILETFEKKEETEEIENVQIIKEENDATDEEQIEYKIFFPFYEWKTLKKYEKVYREEECEIQGETDSVENPKQARIPKEWNLNLTLEGGNSGAKTDVSIKVQKETTVRQLLEDAAAQLGVGPNFWQSLCFVYQNNGNESGIHQANAGEKIDENWTAEKANLFNRRPRLCKFTGITDEDVNRLIEKLLAHKKDRKENNEPNFDSDVEDQMEHFEDIIHDKMKEEIALANAVQRRPRKPLTKGNASFESIVAQYDHRKGQIKAMIDQIQSDQIVKTLTYNDLCYEEDEEVFERLDKETYDEEMESSWALDKKMYKKTPTEDVAAEVESIFKDEFSKVSKERETYMEEAWQKLDAKFESLRDDHDAMLTAAVQQMRKHHKPMTKSERKKGITNLFSRMHSFYFGKLLKPDIVSTVDIHNGQNLTQKKKKNKGNMFGGLSFMKTEKSKDGETTVAKSKNNSKKSNISNNSNRLHKLKKKDEEDELDFSDEGSEEKSDEDDDDLLSESDEDEIDANEKDTKKSASNLPKGSNDDVVALNDSLRRDLDSTMEDSDIVEFGTLEINKAADKYEENYKPTAEQLRLSRDLAREAEQEMLRRQGALGGADMGGSGSNRRQRSVPLDNENGTNSVTNNVDDGDFEGSDWDDEDDSMEEEILNTTSNKVI